MDRYTMNYKGRTLEVYCKGSSVETIKEINTIEEETIPENIKTKVNNFLDWWMS